MVQIIKNISKIFFMFLVPLPYQRHRTDVPHRQVKTEIFNNLFTILSLSIFLSRLY